MAAENPVRTSTRLLAFSLSLAACLVCPLLLHSGELQATASQSAAPPAATAAEIDMTELTGRPWRVTTAPTQVPAGSIYIFLQNGTLLETSCVETYRIATWTSDKRAPQVVHVVEDHRPTFTAAILELTPSTLRLRQRFARTHERREITLTAVTGEFVCPDLPR